MKMAPHFSTTVGCGSPCLCEDDICHWNGPFKQLQQQGVFSLNPSVFDVHLESIIVFDRNDGLLRNEIASHIFYDRNAEQWRGLTVGFSAEGDPQKIEPKQLWAVSSQRDPRFGFTIMKAAKVDMLGGEEDPHIIYDASCVFKSGEFWSVQKAAQAIQPLCMKLIIGTDRLSR